MSEQVIIIGAGVSGITTALALEMLGFETEIITTNHPQKIDQKNNHPEFASLFPSASIIPHSVYSRQLKDIFEQSQTFFYELRKQLFPGITINKHFEIFEREPRKPDYTNWMLNLQDIEEVDPKSVPKRPKSPALHGWVFDCIFADWALYFPALIELYESLGGTISIQQLTAEDIPDLPADLTVNCSGTGAPKLFDDPSGEQLIMRGHLLHKPKAPIIRNSNDETISYNYEPLPSVYSDASGEACDVYCYPRKDGWILGGSRQVESLEDQEFKSQSGTSHEIDGISFPSQIIDLNNKILKHTYGQSLELTDDMSVNLGYRYIRNREDGLRLEKDSVAGKKIYHNYGHGGAGVTLSWGCALDIAGRITGKENAEIQSELLEKFSEAEF